MDITWKVEPEDVDTVRTFYDSYRDDPFVTRRIARNVVGIREKVSREWFWEAMVGCLLSTQQRSGPTSPISRFINTRPFALRYEIALQERDLESYTRNALSDFGGIRRYNQIAKAVVANLATLEDGLWSELMATVSALGGESTPAHERRAAEFIDDHFHGFGPKQSRNLLQWLGLTKYEIPLDSRITKWLNEFGFPVGLSAAALSDRNYYNFVSDGVQALCAQSDLYPCVLDAVIFTSFDAERWTEDNMVY